MDRWVGKVAIVTGASSGIGEAIAISLAKSGIKVVGLARRVERVEGTAGKVKGCKGQLTAVKCDMTKEDDIVNAFQWVAKNVGPVHILVNNAGLHQNSNLINGDVDKWRLQFETNVIGLCVATREAIKIMMANKIDGHIVHINSVLGQQHSYFPTINVYGATKHAVTDLTETLRQELVANDSKIKVTSISPGVVKTDLIAGDSETQKAVHVSPMLQAEDIAEAVVYTLGTPPKVQVSEITIRPVGSPF